LLLLEIQALGRSFLANAVSRLLSPEAIVDYALVDAKDAGHAPTARWY